MENKCFSNKINCFFESQFHLFACSTISFILYEMDRFCRLLKHASIHSHTHTSKKNLYLYKVYRSQCTSVYIMEAQCVNDGKKTFKVRSKRAVCNIVQTLEVFLRVCMCIEYTHLASQCKFTLRVYLWDDSKLSIHWPIPTKVH